MNNINNNGIYQSIIRYSDKLHLIPGAENLIERDINKFKDLNEIDFKVFDSFSILSSQKNRSYEEVAATCSAVVACLKSQNDKLLRITSLKLNQGIFDKLSCFQDNFSALTLDMVSFQNDILPSFSSLASLKNLTISNCTISKIPNDFCPSSLEELTIDSYGLNVPFDLKNALNLHKLSIENYTVSSLPKNPPSKLRILEIKEACNIENFGSRDYANLEVLKVNGLCKGVQTIFLNKAPSNLKKLKIISSSGKKIDCIDCANLEELTIKDSFDLSVLAKIKGKYLKKLCLSESYELQEIPNLDDCPNLKEINLSETGIDILKNLERQLTKINLSNCTSLIYRENMEDLLLNLNKGVAKLNLSSCPAFIKA